MKYFLPFIILFIFSCKGVTDNEVWELKWRTILEFEKGDDLIAFDKLDSLLLLKIPLDNIVLLRGIEKAHSLGKVELIHKLLSRSSNIEQLCMTLSSDVSDRYCKPLGYDTKVGNVDLAKEIAKIHIYDQLSRSVILTDVIEKYDIDTSGFYDLNLGYNIDYYNQQKMKNILDSVGLPTLNDVGIVGISGIFIVAQHADNDILWQKEVLSMFKNASHESNLFLHKIAFLEDRINVAEGKHQMFGTQIKNVDMLNEEIIFHPILDSTYLDERRKSHNLMPFKYYKSLFF